MPPYSPVWWDSSLSSTFVAILWAIMAAPACSSSGNPPDGCAVRIQTPPPPSTVHDDVCYYYKKQISPPDHPFGGPSSSRRNGRHDDWPWSMVRVPLATTFWPSPCRRKPAVPEPPLPADTPVAVPPAAHTLIVPSWPAHPTILPLPQLRPFPRHPSMITPINRPPPPLAQRSPPPWRPTILPTL